MKTSYSTFLTILILISSCTSQADKNSKKFVIQGKTIGQDSGNIVLSYFSDTTYVRDTVDIKNGKFVFSGEIFEPTRATLFGGNNLSSVMVFLEPGKMKINLTKDKYDECKMTGSKTQNDFELLTKLEKPFYDKISILRDQENKINDSIKNSKNDSIKVLLEKKTEEIDKIGSKTNKQIDSIQIKFVMENPKSYLTIVYLYALGGNEVMSLDSTKSIFNRLDNSLKKSIFAKYIIEDIRKKDNMRIGNQAPEFKASDLNQQTITLSQFKGKSEVLIDFWASWCVPCRESIPHLKTIYNKYHSKGLEVIAVSIDEDKKAWIEAVKHDSTGMWYHIPIAEKWPCGPNKLTKNDIEQNYSYKGVPNVLLIDKNGKIIGRFLSASKANKESLDRLLSQIYDN
jgi:thiol-disulfide isomerase/thioredoxin